MTYLEAYGEWLEQQIDKGGARKDMDTAINEYNAVARVKYTPSAYYRAWAKEADHVCGSCGANFRWTFQQAPEPSGEALCDGCSGKVAGNGSDSTSTKSGPAEAS